MNTGAAPGHWHDENGQEATPITPLLRPNWQLFAAGRWYGGLLFYFELFFEAYVIARNSFAVELEPWE